jgi:hypothetical protein
MHERAVLDDLSPLTIPFRPKPPDRGFGLLGLRRRFEPPLTTHDGRTYDPLTFHSHTHIHTNTHATPITSLEELNPESLSA